MLRLVLPKGSLERATLELFEAADLTVRRSSDVDYRATIDDPRVAVIAGYLESVRDGAKFQRVARRALERGKPIVVLKVGTTDVGGRAVRSHTGALAGADAVYDAVFATHGVVRADSIEALIDCLKVFAAYPGALQGASRRTVSFSTALSGFVSSCAFHSARAWSRSPLRQSTSPRCAAISASGRPSSACRR